MKRIHLHITLIIILLLLVTATFVGLYRKSATSLVVQPSPDPLHIPTDSTTTEVSGGPVINPNVKSIKEPFAVGVRDFYYSERFPQIEAITEDAKTHVITTLGEPRRIPSISVIGNNMWYLSEGNLYKLATATWKQTKELDVSSLGWSQDEIELVVVSPDESYLLVYVLPLVRDPKGYNSVNGAELWQINLKTKSKELIIDLRKAKIVFDFNPNFLKWVDANTVMLYTAYGDAGAAGSGYYLINVPKKELLELAIAELGSDSGQYGTLGSTKSEFSLRQKTYITNNMNIEAGVSGSEAPLKKSDYKVATDKGYIASYTLAGEVTKKDIDFTKFIVLEKAQDWEVGPDYIEKPARPVSSAIGELFSISGAVYVSAKAPAGSEYFDATSDGWYIWQNGSWESIPAQDYYAAHYKWLNEGAEDAYRIGDQVAVSDYDSVTMHAASGITTKVIDAEQYKLLGVVK